MNSHLRPYNRCISNISTNIYLGLDFNKKIIPKKLNFLKKTLSFYTGLCYYNGEERIRKELII